MCVCVVILSILLCKWIFSTRHYVYIESVDVFVWELVVVVTKKQNVNLTSDNTSLVVILNTAENKKGWQYL